MDDLHQASLHPLCPPREHSFSLATLSSLPRVLSPVTPRPPRVHGPINFTFCKASSSGLVVSLLLALRVFTPALDLACHLPVRPSPAALPSSHSLDFYLEHLWALLCCLDSCAYFALLLVAPLSLSVG